MYPQQLPAKSAIQAASTVGTQSKNERQIGLIDLEGGGYVRIVCEGEIDTEEALEWAEDIIQRKRRELARRKERASSASKDLEEGGKNFEA